MDPDPPVQSNGLWYNTIFFAMIIAFTYFYVAITFDPVEVAGQHEEVRRLHSGIRAGKPTEDYLAFVLSRLTAPGSLYLGLISLIPSIAFLFQRHRTKFLRWH